MYIQELIIILAIFLFYFFSLKKFTLLNDNQSNSEHKKFITNHSSPILLGGIFVFTIILFFLSNEFLFLKFILSSILILGILSDKNILPNPKLRLFIQIVILFGLVYLENLEINNLSLSFFNNLLSNNIFNVCFTVFCLAILINGSNFIDGLNGLLTGYYIMVILSIIFVIKNFNILDLPNYEILDLVLISLLIFFVFNLFGIVFLGDSGSYLISAFIGIYLIKLSLININLSPYYVALLLWYPVFENLFSLLRRTLKNKNVSLADNLHFHQLFYLYFKSLKFINKKRANSLTGLIILFLNLPSFIIASLMPFHSSKLVVTIIVNIILYLLIYRFLFNRFTSQK